MAVKRVPLVLSSAAPALGLFLVCLVLPALFMVAVTFATSSFSGIEWSLTLANYRRLFAGAPLWLLAKSLGIATLVTAIVLLLAYPLAYGLARMRSRYRHLLLLLIFVPYWISYVIRTYAWYPLLGTNGVLNHIMVSLGLLNEPTPILLFSPFSVHLGLIYVYFPFAAIPIYLALDRIDRSVIEASSDLGASSAQTFRRVIFPLSLPGTVGGGSLVFILAAGAYVTPKLLGGPSGIMYGEIIADQFGGTFNWSFGATLAVAFVLAVGAIVLAFGRKAALRDVFFKGA